MEISITDLLVKPEQRPDQPKGNAVSAMALSGLFGQFSDMMRQATNGDAFAPPTTREPVSESRAGTRGTGERAAETVRDDTDRSADAVGTDNRPAPADTPSARETDIDDGASRSSGDDTPPEHAGTDADGNKDAPNGTAEGAKSGTDNPGHAAENGLETAAAVSAAITPAGILDVAGKAAGLDLMAIAQPGASAKLNNGTALSTAPLATPGAGLDIAAGAAITDAAANGSPSLPGTNPALAMLTNTPHAEAADKAVNAALANLANLATNAKGSGAAEQALATLTVPANAKSALVDGPGQAPISITVTEATPNLVSKPSAMLVATGPAADDASVAGAKAQAGGTAQSGGQQGANASTVAQAATDAAGLANNGAAGQIPSGAATAGLNATAAASYGVAQSTANSGAVTMDSPAPVAPIGGAGLARTASPVQPLSAATRPTPVTLPVVDQLAVHIVKAAAAGMDKISITLRPAALGHIEIQLELSHDGRIAAVVTAEKSETLELLQRDARGLERALQEAGLRTNSDSLNFNLRGEGSDDGQETSDHAAPEADIQAAIETLDDIHAAQMAGYANARAALGGVDIRV
ncbi:MAG: flagellar hook-length control protein FliK [Proteobacteria bacterium]|nr:flagellar hook-length control protein FliK [Pseudomonadota bacterium]